MTQTLLVLCLLAAAMAAQAQSPAPADCGLDAAAAQRASRVVTELVTRGHAPGAVLDIRCHGKPWLQMAAGQTDRETGTPAAADQLFRIYSMTKPVTAAGVLMLVADGKLALDAPISRYLPEWAHPSVFVGEADGQLKTRPAVRPPTVRQLLSHQTGVAYLAPTPHPVLKLYATRGIDNGSGEEHRPTDGSAPVASAAELSQRLAQIPLLHEPGAAWTYGNSNDLAGALIERVTGQRLSVFLQERLFGPLGMQDSMFRVPDAQQSRFVPAYLAKTQRPPTTGLGFANVSVDDLGPSELVRRDGVDASSPFRRQRPIDFGGAGLVSTAADYQRFLTFLLQDGRWGERQLLPAELAREMRRDQLSEQAQTASGMRAKRGMGFGLSLGVIEAREPQGLPVGMAFWGGAASTYGWLQPREGITVVLMTQVFGGDVAPYQTLLAKALMPQAASVAKAP